MTKLIMEIYWESGDSLSNDANFVDTDVKNGYFSQFLSLSVEFLANFKIVATSLLLKA
jgi:hypothetical protein